MTDLEIPSLDVLQGSADLLTFWRFDSSSVYTQRAGDREMDGCVESPWLSSFLSVFEQINQRVDRAGPYAP